MINNVDIIRLIDKFIEPDKISEETKISEQKGGLFNDVIKVEDGQRTWYLKKYLEQNTSKVFSPPKISPQVRSKLAYFVQKECYNINEDIQTVPNIFIDIDENTLIIEGILNPIVLIDLISKNNFKISHIKSVSKTISRLHSVFFNNSETSNDPILRNLEFKNFKLKIQYEDIANQLGGKYSDLINCLLNEYKDQYLTVLHGDLNSRNIIVNKVTGNIGIIDFEQSHIGNPIYDIAYFLCEIYISCLYFDNSEFLQKSVQAFFQSYIENNPDFKIINDLEQMKMHIAVQIIYRFLGPSKNSWTFYIEEQQKNDIISYAKEILITKKEKYIDHFFDTIPRSV